MKVTDNKVVSNNLTVAADHYFPKYTTQICMSAFALQPGFELSILKFLFYMQFSYYLRCSVTTQPTATTILG